jgi:CP family cyanate transporter-like MFS transporter
LGSQAGLGLGLQCIVYTKPPRAPIWSAFADAADRTAKPRGVLMSRSSQGVSRRSVGGTFSLLGALFFAALSLRPQLVGVAPLVGEMQQDLGLSHAQAGLLGTIPVLCMGLFAPVAPFVAARVGTRVAVGLSIALIGGFGLARAVSADGFQLAVLTIGVGVGMGIGGTLLPVFVKERLVDHPVGGTASYSSGLQLGSAASAALAVPLALVLDGWRGVLAVFSVLTLALSVPWMTLTHHGHGVPRRITASLAAFADRRGWALAGLFALFGIVYYGVIAWMADAYVEAGWTPAAAGAMLGLLNIGSLAGSLTIGFAVGRLVSYGSALRLMASLFASSIVGFVIAPVAGFGWAILAGYANGALFPLVLALPLRFAGTADRVAGLSAVMLGVGYTVAALSPVGLGAVRDATGSFRESLLVLVVAVLVFVVGVVLVARDRGTVEIA